MVTKAKDKVTIQDIADKTGLSTATISKYLNGKPVGEKSRQKIQQTIEELHYQPSRAAQTLRSGKTSLIGIIISDIGNYFWSPLISALSTSLSQEGYTVILRSHHNDVNRKKALINEMISQKFAGFILFADSDNDYTYLPLAQKHLPVILIDNVPKKIAENPVDCVVSDNYGGGKLLAEYLIKKGHQHLYVDGPFLDSYTTKQRIQGICDACTKSGLSKPMIESPVPYTTSENTVKHGERTIHRFFSSNKKATAAIFTTYEIAVGALSAVNKYHYRIPDDLSIVSFDDDPLFKCIYPPVTAVAQNTDLFCTAIVQLLLRRMRNDYSDFPKTEFIPVTFHERYSVKYEKGHGQ